MFYSLLGRIVWDGLKLVMRQKYGPTYVPKALVAGAVGAVAGGAGPAGRGGGARPCPGGAPAGGGGPAGPPPAAEVAAGPPGSMADRDGRVLAIRDHRPGRPGRAPRAPRGRGGGRPAAAGAGQ